MIIGALDGLLDFAIPTMTEGSQNIFDLFCPKHHKFKPHQTKIIPSHVSLSNGSGSGNAVGMLTDKLKYPFQLVSKYIFPNQMGRQIMVAINNRAQVNQQINPGDKMCSLAGIINQQIGTTAQYQVNIPQQIHIQANSFAKVKSNINEDGNPFLYKGIINEEFQSRQMDNSAIIVILNKTTKKIKLSKNECIGWVTYCSHNPTDIATFNLPNPSGLNIDSNQILKYGKSNQIRMPISFQMGPGHEKVKLPTIIKGLISTLRPAEKKVKATNYERVLILKDLAVNMLDQFKVRQTFLSDFTAAGESQVSTHQKRDQKKKHHHQGLLGMFFQPIASITRKIFATKVYKIKQGMNQIIIQKNPKKLIIKGQVIFSYQNDNLFIESEIQAQIQIDFIY